MDSFFKLIAAGPAFFVSAWLLMLFAGAVSTDVGVRPFGYLTSMVVTIALWLTVAPAIGAVAGRAGTRQGQEERQPRDALRTGHAKDCAERLDLYQFLRVFPTLYQFRSFLRPYSI